MGIFDSSTERNNKRSKNIRRVKRSSLVDWLPDSEKTMDFSVFGGTSAQRCAVINHAIARMYGECGIIVIHNDDLMERYIYNFPHYYPSVVEGAPNVNVGYVSGTNCIYDPFLGLDDSDIVGCIYPKGNSDFNMRAEGLRQYISILRYNGIFPTLQNLNRLCGMTLDRIEQELMGKIPDGISRDIMSVLMQNNLHLQVKADVRMFADKLQGKIWTAETAPTNISMISAVRQKALLSIKLSANNMDVLDYLAAECNFLINKGEHFLLIVDSVILGNSDMQEIVRHSGNQYAKILAGPNHMDMLKGGNTNGTELPDSLAQKVILFSLTNQAVAEYYSNIIGKYLKIDESTSEKSGPGSGFFGAKDPGSVSRHETNDSRMRAEELTRLGSGAVMLRRYAGQGFRDSDVELAEHFELPPII